MGTTLKENSWVIIGFLLSLGLVWGLYQTFFVTQPRWGAMPHEIEKVSLESVAGKSLDAASLPLINVMYVNTWSDRVIVFQNDGLLTDLPTGHQFPSVVAIDEVRNRVYIPNWHEDTVTLFEGISQTTTIPVGGTHPKDIAINPKTGLAYVIGRGESKPDGQGRLRWHNYLTVLDGNKVVETRYFTQSGFNQVAVDPINDYLYIGADKNTKKEQGCR